MRLIQTLLVKTVLDPKAESLAHKVETVLCSKAEIVCLAHQAILKVWKPEIHTAFMWLVAWKELYFYLILIKNIRTETWVVTNIWQFISSL